VEPVVTGKPESYFVEYALRRFGVEPDEAFIVGDNLKTDIEAGRRLGLYTVHVRTGVTYMDEPDAPKPDEVCASVAELWLNGLPC
jgi:ribonucleotide monophosphatase NagD (HAD superfamily)